MKLVVDTNRIIAALIKDSASRKVLLSGTFDFMTIGVAREEISDHKAELLKKSNLTLEQFDGLLSLLFSKLSVVNDALVKTKMGEAKKIMDRIDRNDTPFIALALAVENAGIWSEDKHFEKQTKLKNFWNLLMARTAFRRCLCLRLFPLPLRIPSGDLSGGLRAFQELRR